MKEILVGIDFGTTNTVVTYFSNNKAIVMNDGVFKTIPSKIGKLNNKFYCGNYIPINCNDIIHSFKITIGEENEFSFNNDEKKYKHTDLLIIFFKHLFDLIIKNLKLENPIIKTVITVPSNFNDKQREIIRKSFILSGFNVIRIINEPSAAALAYGLNYSTNNEERILVIDTGGGTMDFTILEKNELFFEVIHSEGLNDLGGNNFTQIIVDDILRTYSNISNSNILWNQAQKIKEKLTYLEIYETKINNEKESLNYILTRTRFENLSNKLLKKVEDVLIELFKNYNNINYIVLVGGTSRIPIIQKTIKDISQKTPWIHPNLESVVAEGAGLYTGIIENVFTLNEDVVLMDVLPLSLGVELVDGSYSIIIPKNTPLPIKRSQKYTTDSPAESSVKIKVYQGERKIANKNFLIGEFIFDKVSMGGVPIIEISFKVDLNSIINVSVIDRKSGVEKNIIIKDIPKIEINELEELIEQANKLSDNDEHELLRIQNIYLIKTHIENSLINLQLNELINEDDKKLMLDKFKSIEEQLYEMNNLQLTEALTYLQKNYSLLGVAQTDEINNQDTDDILGSNNNLNSDIEKLFLNDRKAELKNRINILLVRNPDWNEYLEPVLNELGYNNVSIDYINEKLKLLDELENDNNIIDYKEEVNKLCLYIKSELELGNINLGEKNKLLEDLINNTLIVIVEDNKTINWEEQLDILNKKCEEIYNI